ncbi:MAG: GFA family protein [Pseudomonadota bacterium]
MMPYSGCCLCGAVRFEMHGLLRPAYACHCGQCRRQSGHYVAVTSARRADFVLLRDDTLKWYRSSDLAQRGFCGECGSVLFWDDGGDAISINAGSLDQPTGLKIEKHIFVDDKGDYYEIADNLPQFAGYDRPLAPQ